VPKRTAMMCQVEVFICCLYEESHFQQCFIQEILTIPLLHEPGVIKSASQLYTAHLRK
jgi:hypothetical protein